MATRSEILAEKIRKTEEKAKRENDRLKSLKKEQKALERKERNHNLIVKQAYTEKVLEPIFPGTKNMDPEQWTTRINNLAVFLDYIGAYFDDEDKLCFKKQSHS